MSPVHDAACAVPLRRVPGAIHPVEEQHSESMEIVCKLPEEQTFCADLFIGLVLSLQQEAQQRAVLSPRVDIAVAAKTSQEQEITRSQPEDEAA